MGFTDGRKIVGLYTAQVSGSQQISPHMMRLTFHGEDLTRLPRRGFDAWFRLFLPRDGGHTNFDAVPQQFTMGSYLKYLTSKSGTRPPFRNYTVREHRPADGEIDVDFVIHGDRGIAGPWAQRATAGEQVALIDQGRGFDPLGDADSVLLVGDESALPALAGILRDLPREATGTAIVEVPEAADEQPVDAPSGVEVRWLPRAEAPGADAATSPDPDRKPGHLALAELRALHPGRPEQMQAYVVGEQRLAAEGRRHLVACGVPKARIAFTGYWKAKKGG